MRALIDLRVEGLSRIEIDAATARAFNRHFAGRFAYFPTVRHLITGCDDLATDMTRAPYDLIEEQNVRSHSSAEADLWRLCGWPAMMRECGEKSEARARWRE